MAIIRLSEPYVWNHFKQDVKYLFSRKLDGAAKQKFSSKPLCAFANSAMNIEFVYLILLGINNFLDSRDARKSSLVMGTEKEKMTNSKLKIVNHGKSTNITFCDIKMKDIDKWNVDYQSKASRLDDDIQSVESFGDVLFENFDDK